MNIQNLTNSNNFQGKFVIKNKLSGKPTRCVKKVKNNIEELVRQKDYNLYLHQDYSKQNIEISAAYPFPIKPSQRLSLTEAKEFIPVTSEASKYIDAAKKTINGYDKAIREKEMQEFMKRQNEQAKEELKLIPFAFLLIPWKMLEIMLEGVAPKIGKKLNDFNLEGKIYNFVTKKG